MNTAPHGIWSPNLRVPGEASAHDVECSLPHRALTRSSKRISYAKRPDAGVRMIYLPRVNIRILACRMRSRTLFHHQP